MQNKRVRAGKGESHRSGVELSFYWYCCTCPSLFLLMELFDNNEMKTKLTSALLGDGGLIWYRAGIGTDRVMSCNSGWTMPGCLPCLI